MEQFNCCIKSSRISSQILANLKSYIENNYEIEEFGSIEYCSINIEDLIEKPTQKNVDKIELEDSFSNTLKSLILKKGIQTKSELYDEIGMSKVGFWKIETGAANPSRLTVFAIAFALKLSLNETEDLLMKAGYAVNKSSLQEVVLSGCIECGIYDRYAIDELLDSLDLEALPGTVN